MLETTENSNLFCRAWPPTVGTDYSVFYRRSKNILQNNDKSHERIEPRNNPIAHIYLLR